MPYGIVKEKKKELAVVVMERGDMCGSCHACEMISGKKTCTLTCKDEVQAEVGDLVELALGNEHFLKATYTMYGVPLLGLVMGLLMGIGAAYGLNLKLVDLWCVLGGILGTGIGLFYIKCQDKKQKYEKYLPHIVTKIEKK